MDEEAFINDVLTQAAIYINEHYPPSSADTKAPREVVTEVDIAVEQQLRQQIMQAFPDHGIRGEELADHQPEAKNQWIIDPVDGTTNYAHNIPVFCCAVALLCEGRAQAAGVINPVTGDIWSATRNKGARRNAEEIKTPNNPLSKSLIGYCHANDEEGIQTISKYYPVLKHASRDFRRLGSANLELAMTASGELGAFIGYRIQPWDFIPGCLIAQEAGCAVTGFSSEDWQTPDTRSVLASNQAIHAEIQALLNK